jgi:hypothetical protein
MLQLEAIPNTDKNTQTDEQSLAFQQYDLSLADLAARVPEISANSEIIRTAGAELITEFGIKPELFLNKPHSLFFVAIAARFGDLESRKGELDAQQYSAERGFIGDALTLLALDKAKHYEQVKRLIDSNDNKDESTRKAVFDRFTDKQLTGELKKAISGGLLSGVKERLGISEDGEDQYDVRVLSIAKDELLMIGIRPQMSNGLKERIEKGSYDAKAMQEHNADVDAFRNYRDGLIKRGKEFNDLLGVEAEIPIAWVTRINDVRTLCLPMPFAEKILYKDQARASYYTEDDRQRDFAVLEHEYVHTQGGLNMDGDLFYGIGFEERRAEFFGGDKQGYQDVKGWILDVSIVTGVNLLDIIGSQPKGGESGEFYAHLVSELGLQATLELALAVPRAYIDESRKLQKNVNDFLGGLDGVTQRIYTNLVKAGHSQGIEDRINIQAQNMSGRDLDLWAQYRRKGLGLIFVTDQLMKKVADIRMGATKIH